MTPLQIPAVEFLALSILVLFLGIEIDRRVGFLSRNHVPPAVVGGLLFAAAAAVIQLVGNYDLTFDSTLRDVFLLVFFSTIGLCARIDTLIRGGRLLLLLVPVAAVFLFLQNAVGIGIALLFDADPAYGLMAGSISFAGGHGTAVAWGTEFEQAGLQNAAALGLSFATFGLLAGGLLGGPVARFLLRRSGARGQPAEAVEEFPKDGAEPQGLAEHDWLRAVLHTGLMLALCVSLGDLVNRYLSGWFFRLPGFVTAMLVGIVLSNLLGRLGRPVAYEAAERFGVVSLHVFLVMSMMSMDLLALASAAAPIVVALLAQVLLMTSFVMLVVFYVCGRDYDAVVISSGFAGMGLGATPVAIANMDAVTNAHGPSPKAFLIIPLLGAFFIDLLNAGTVTYFLRLIEG